jgi:hypothetical protein
MPRQQKYDEIPFEKVVFNGKIFMYTSPDWKTLYPVVDIIRLLKPNTIISHKVGKGQDTIRTYGCQYNHRIIGDTLTTKKDYLGILKMVKCIFTFSDSYDIITTNLINAAKTNKLPYVCYSTLDNIYHFYFNEIIKEFKTAKEVVDHMYILFDLDEVKKLAELFPEFEIITPEALKNTTLDECREILKKTESEVKKKERSVKLFDPHLAKLKKMERDRIKVQYSDDIEKINKQFSGVNFLSKLLKKN